MSEEKETKDTLKEPEVQKLVVCRDDFIEWILRSTNEDSEFTIHKTKSYILVGIDRVPFLV